MSFKIYTHNGKAHIDELLGIALLMIYKKMVPEEIIRITPEEAESIVNTKIIDDDTYFIDCGLQYKPEKNLFDHHQSRELGCSAKLIFDYYFSDLTETSIYEYINLVSKVDTKGPSALDDFKFKSDTIFYFSFSQRLILREFENDPIQISSIFSNGLLDLINFENDKKLGLTWLMNPINSSIIKINNIVVLVYNNIPPFNLSRAIKTVNSDLIEEKSIDIIYGYDKEDNTIRTLFRTLKADKSVDFSTSKVKNTIFCHNSGFLLKFIPESESEFKDIIKESIK